MTIALVVNPTKTQDVQGLCRTVQRRCAALGLAAVVLLETTEQDAGERLTRRAVQDGATLVLAAGGDGTVRAVSAGLQHGGVPLGVLPLGTGNLLARNLGLPLQLDHALDVALTGQDRVLDLGQVSADGGAPECFVVMAGLGFDAEMMADAPERMKGAVGWPAYVVSGLRHLRDRPVLLEVSLDGGAPVSHQARGVVIGNVGTLQAGVALLPGAVPDDGVLDLVVLAPRGLLDWGRLLVRLASRSTREDRTLQRSTARTLRITAGRPTHAQLDGDPLGELRSLVVDVVPGSLLVRVTRSD